MELSRDLSPADVNEIDIGDTSCDDFEVNKVSKGKNGNNNFRKGGYSNN